MRLVPKWLKKHHPDQRYDDGFGVDGWVITSTLSSEDREADIFTVEMSCSLNDGKGSPCWLDFRFTAEEAGVIGRALVAAAGLVSVLPYGEGT